MRHTSLKTDIKIAQATARIQRAEASKLIRKGRDLRKQATAEPDPTKKARMASVGWVCRDDSMGLRATANAGRNDRRHMHLAAALLNGKTYLQCEKEAEDKPSPTGIAAWIKPHLPVDEQAHAEFIAETWLTTGEIRHKEIREQGLVERLALDKKAATITGLKVQIKTTDREYQSHQSQVMQTERYLAQHKANAAKWYTKLGDLQTQCSKLESSLQADKDALTASKAVTRSIDDLFEDAA